MWSVVGATASARWLWHALDHSTGRVLAYVLGPRKDTQFLKLRALLAPLSITDGDSSLLGFFHASDCQFLKQFSLEFRCKNTEDALRLNQW
jgi:IS1 family transposase